MKKNCIFIFYWEKYWMDKKIILRRNMRWKKYSMLLYIFFLLEKFFLNLHLDWVDPGARWLHSIFRRYWTNGVKTLGGMADVYYEREHYGRYFIRTPAERKLIVTFGWKFVKRRLKTVSFRPYIIKFIVALSLENLLYLLNDSRICPICMFEVPVRSKLFFILNFIQFWSSKNHVILE